MKCPICQSINFKIVERLNELDNSHSEEFIKFFEKTIKCWPSFGEPDRTEVSMKELLYHKKAQYEAGWLDAIEEISQLLEENNATQ